MENGLDVEGLFHRAALNTKDPLELVEVQRAAWTFLHEKEAQVLNLRQVQLLGAALVLSHVPPDGLLSVGRSSHNPRSSASSSRGIVAPAPIRFTL